jgi:sugar phosphate isomerase/epimerase
MIPTLNAVTAGGGLALADYISLAARNDFSGVDFSIQTVADAVEQNGFDAVAKLFEQPKVLPAAFGLPVEWRKDEETYQRGLEQLPRLAKLAQDLDCTRCGTWVLPDNGEPVGEYAARSKKRFAEMAQVLAEQGIRLGLEFLGPQHFRPDPDNVWFYDLPGTIDVVEEIEDEYSLENLGVLIDGWHWYTSGGTMMDLAAIPLEKIVHVHVNDAPDLPLHQQQDKERLLPGESGVIDVVGLLKTLGALGYDGPVAVETFSNVLRDMAPEEAARRAGESMIKIFAAAGIEPLRLV